MEQGRRWKMTFKIGFVFFPELKIGHKYPDDH